MSSVPPLPGYQVRKPKQEHNPRLQTLQWKKGVPLSAPTTGPPRADEIELDDIFNKEYSLRFGDKRHLPAKQSRFLPKWAIYEKKVLQFSGYFTESLDEDKKDVFRVHQIIFRYHLLDDTISIHEPKTANSGLIQGLLLKRQRVPRPVTRGGTLAEEGEGRQSPNERFWHWSDLNRGVTVDVYGRKYILCDCDEFTKEFLLSEGSELNPPLEVPPDPYETLRESRKETPQRSSDLRGISGMSGSRIIFKDLILKFHVMVEEDLDGKKSKATSAALSYRMSDGKIEIRKSLPYEDYEIKRFSPIMLKWSKVPLEVAGKAGAANVGEEEEFGVEHLTPVHLAPPITVSVFGRKVLVTGCDEQTSNILEQLYGVKGTPVLSRQIEEKPKLSSARVTSDILARPRPKQGILSEEDCKYEERNLEDLTSVLKESKKQFGELLCKTLQKTQNITNFPGSTILRFSAQLESKDEDENTRNFILTYYTIDDTFEMYEKPISGGLGGKLLARSKIPKPKQMLKSTTEETDQSLYAESPYYNLGDIYIGKKLNIWGRDYIVNGADRFVHTFAEENPQIVTPNLMQSLRAYFGKQEDKIDTNEDGTAGM